jgi:hypothetical protein
MILEFISQMWIRVHRKAWFGEKVVCPSIHVLVRVPPAAGSRSDEGFDVHKNRFEIPLWRGNAAMSTLRRFFEMGFSIRVGNT